MTLNNKELIETYKPVIEKVVNTPKEGYYTSFNGITLGTYGLSKEQADKQTNAFNERHNPKVPAQTNICREVFPSLNQARKAELFDSLATLFMELWGENNKR